ncbi:MAG: ABC transporter permease [Chloroflexota bacterium]
MKGLFDPLTSALASVVAHKLRSFLTVLGIVIGVAAVIALLSIGRGAQSEIVTSIESLGANLVQVMPGAGFGPGGVREGSSATLTLEDAEAVEDQVSNIAAVAPQLSTNSRVIAGQENTSATITGTTADYRLAYNAELTYGTFFSDYDYERGAKVAVLGATVADELYGELNPVGESIKIGRTVARVIGVLEERGASFTSADDAILMPLTVIQQTAAQQRTATGEHVISMIGISVSEKGQSEEVVTAITEVLRTRHRLLPADEDDFNILSAEEIATQVSEALGIFTIFLGAIAGISLLVGGIGVMNIMLVSVLERTREIGIRKALGAQEKDIWMQFLVEAAILSLAGGVIGIATGWGISLGVDYFVEEITPLVAPDIILLAVSVSVGIGLFFGFYPAYRASRLNPIEALRTE